MRWWIRPQPHPQNLFHTGEFDPDFGMTGMRRIWNLVAGPFQYHDTLFAMRGYDGFINLDAYKDWNLAWSDDTRPGTQLPVTVHGPLWHMNMTFRVMAEQIASGSHYRQSENMWWAKQVLTQLADPDGSAS